MNKEYFKKLILKLLIIIAIVLSILLVILGIIILFSAFLMYMLSQESTIYKSPNEYNKCLKSEYSQEKIKHFPKTIPNNVQEAKLYCVPASHEYDGSLILLKLKVNKEYVKNELKSYKFLNSNTPIGTPQKIYHMPSENTVDINRNELTYYVLDNEDNKWASKSYFPYFNGIGVDKNYEYILYYYIMHDD